MWTDGRWLILSLALLGGCTGVIQATGDEQNAVSRDPEDDDDAVDDDSDDEVSDDPRSENDDTPVRDASRADASTRADAGRDAGRDASRIDAADPEDDRDDGSTLLHDAGDEDEPDASADAGKSDAGASACKDGARPPASGLRLRELSLYQTVKVTLMSGGTWSTSRAVPVVQGKRALVRAFVDTLPGYARHAVRGVLRLGNGQSTSELTSERTIVTSSTDADETSTFTFDVPAAQLDDATTVSIALEETSCTATASGSASDTRFPASGTQALGATAIGPLRVVLVPVNMSGRLPDTSDTQIAAIRSALLAYYPVPSVEVTVRRPYTYTGALAGSNGTNWSNLLNEILRERRTDNPASDVYYFGIVKPADTMRAYCGRGCILGIAPQVTRTQTSMQGGLGAMFADAQSYETIVHEIGHAHGRGHAPCAAGGQIQGVDGSFPDRTGSIGTWGWDSRTSTLKAPTHKDIMGYCQPNWISAYTYGALATRAQQVNLRAFVQPPPVTTLYRQIVLYEDGAARWGGLDEPSLPSSGEVEIARTLDAAGRTLGQIEVARVALSHSADQFLYVPALPADVTALALGERVLPLASIAPVR